MLVIRDPSGVVPSVVLRRYFEKSIQDTDALSKAFPLDCETDLAGVVVYANQSTHLLWCGFALGMRAAERVSRSK